MAPTSFIYYRNINMSTAVDGLQSNPSNYDHISDMHNVLLGVLAMATTVTVVWWQGRDNRGRRNARVSIDEPVIELDDLPANQATADADHHEASNSTIDSAGAGGDEGNPASGELMQLTVPNSVDASGLNQLVNPINDTQDAPEHSTIDNGQMEGAVDNPTVVHAVEGVLQETDTHEF
ncbi:hypothetical protein LTS10_012803 [Elasticomyces elasticus]|nr:hypothetical protein LTS10_012803 [Elasticomyces elasticus]